MDYSNEPRRNTLGLDENRLSFEDPFPYLQGCKHIYIDEGKFFEILAEQNASTSSDSK